MEAELFPHGSTSLSLSEILPQQIFMEFQIYFTNFQLKCDVPLHFCCHRGGYILWGMQTSFSYEKKMVDCKLIHLLPITTLRLKPGLIYTLSRNRPRWFYKQKKRLCMHYLPPCFSKVATDIKFQNLLLLVGNNLYEMQHYENMRPGFVCWGFYAQI